MTNAKHSRLAGVLVLFVVAAALAGCGSIETFVNQGSDLASGNSAARVEAAQQRQDTARAENAVLQQQLVDVNAESAKLKSQINASRVALQRIKDRIVTENRATDEQRQTYQRLVDKQKELQRRLATLSSSPPQDSAGAVAQQKQLDQLSAERAQLQKQVDALQRAL
jgi:chromosome segregation ATPase